MNNRISFFDELFERYSEAVKALIESKAEHERELESLINDKSDENLLLDVIDVNTRRARDAMVDGDETIAAGYQKRADDANLQVDTRQERIKYLAFEINRIESEILQVSKKVLQDSYPGIKTAVHLSWNEAFDFADAAWRDLQAFSGKTGIEIPRRYRNGFAFFDYDDTRELYRRLKSWVGTPI